MRLPLSAAIAAVVVLTPHLIGTYQRNTVWRTDETLWQDVVAKSPRNGRGLMNYGLTQMRQGRFPVAKDLFTRAYEFTPNYALLHVNLAIVSDAMGDSLKAGEWFKRAVATDPKHPVVHRFFARWLARHGRSPEAIAHLETAIALSPGDIEARHSLLDLYAARGDTSRLSELARRTLKVAATDSLATEYARGLGKRPSGTAQSWYARGLAMTNVRQYASAAYAYRAALTLDSANADAWNNLGWTLGVLGFISEAIPSLERAIRLRPDYTLARNNLAWAKRILPSATFRRAFDLQTSGRAAEAIPIYRQLITEYPEWVEAHYNLGHALMTVNQCREAVNELEKTLALKADYSVAHLHLATCLRQLGRDREAARHQALYDGAQAGAAVKSNTPGL